ncbi:MAG: thermonuclease family protein [Lachnospiraceae bacterium]
MHLLNQLIKRQKNKLKRKVKRLWITNYIYLIVALCVISLFIHFLKPAPEVVSGSIPYVAETEGSQDRISTELLRVVDGDTIVVDIDGEEFKIRLIGIDTPESVHSDASRNNEYGQMASDYTKELLADQEMVWIEYDQEAEDRYGRQLGYVWLDPDAEDLQYMVNYILVANGYAINKEYPPNTRYASYFQEACQEAMEADAGLWVYEDFWELWE